MKRFVSIILILSLVIGCFCACGKENNDDDDLNSAGETTVSTGNLKLSYSRSDSLNPFNCKTVINLQITGLIYDGLFKLDSNYEPQPSIAKSSIISGRTINVTLNDVLFSDGSSLTAEDVVYSYNIAKESDNYSSSLSNFKSVSVSSSNMIMFVLEKADPYAVSCLNFPIVKSGSYSETEEEETYPIGSGRYMLASDGDDKYLIVNTNKSAFNPAIKTIYLEPVHDSDSAESSIVIGNTAFFYDELSDGTYSRINANSKDLGINNLVYLGFNSSCSFFEDSSIRQALSLAIDRNSICTGAFSNHARASVLPFNPDWYALKSYTSSNDYNLEEAKSLVEESEIDTQSRELTLLYNKENEFKSEAAKDIEAYLEELGFIVRLSGVESQYFQSEVENGNYDLYLGEVKLPYNMDLEAIFTGDSSYGYASVSESAEKYNDFLSDNCEIMDFINTFNSDMPLIPICFRNAVVSYTNAISGDFNCSEADVYYDIDTWSIK